MTRKWFCALAAFVLLLALSACTPTTVPEPESSYPTLPSFPEDQTPLQQLEAAITKTEKECDYEIHYGTIVKVGEESTENVQSQTISADQALDRDAMYTYVPYLPDNEGFLEAFCDRRVEAIPSNTGIIRYQLTDLSWEDAQSLLYSQSPEGDLSGGVWAISMELDARGRFSKLEITTETETEAFTAFLSITFPDTP